jgi:hypothetical protein
MKLFSLDAETTNLYGDSLAIAVEVTENGQVVAQFLARLADEPATTAAKACSKEEDKFVEATLLQLLGEDASSVDTYIEKNGLTMPFEGKPHHPMYDAVAARVVWEHAYSRIVS